MIEFAGGGSTPLVLKVRCEGCHDAVIELSWTTFMLHVPRTTPPWKHPQAFRRAASTRFVRKLLETIAAENGVRTRWTRKHGFQAMCARCEAAWAVNYPHNVTPIEER